MGRVVAYVPDLMDRSRFVGDVVFVSTLLALVECAPQAQVVVVDAGRPGALEAVKQLPPGIQILGFASHIDTDLFEAAGKLDGFTLYPRSRFFSRIVKTLAQ